MQSFNKEVSEEADKLVARVQAIYKMTEELAVLLGEDPKTKFEELFALFNEFRDTYIATEADLEKKDIAAAKEAERQKRMAVTEDAKDDKKDGETGEKKTEEKNIAVVDKVVGDLHKKNANLLSDMLRERRFAKEKETRDGSSTAVIPRGRDNSRIKVSTVSNHRKSFSISVSGL